MGVWIETNHYSYIKHVITVTPYVGVWIETEVLDEIEIENEVTPYVGVWIETLIKASAQAIANRHTLRGCVD